MGRKASYDHQPKVFAMSDPQALEREIVTNNQVWLNEEIIIWGADNALPLRIIDAVNSSPTATSCLQTTERFLQGAKFTDEGLMTAVINKDGMTLWDYHCQICHSMSLLRGFTSRYTYDNVGRITGVEPLDLESSRFVKPRQEKSKTISELKYNPYFGTSEYKQEYSKSYPLYTPNKADVLSQIRAMGDAFPGQVFFYGPTRKPYKFYPVPAYWSGKEWIYVDAGIQTYNKSNIDNGFFISVLLNMIGDPTHPSKNPKYRIEKEGTDGEKRAGRPVKTVGEEFAEMMGSSFSGAKKAGAVMTWWSKNKDEAPNVQQFPSNTNFEQVSGTFIDAIRGITIATNVPAILANLPQQASSLGSDGATFQKAIELMQSRVAPDHQVLENYYNSLLAKLQQPIKQRVKIANYTPVTLTPELPDKVWEWMNDEEKAEFVKENYPSIKVSRGTSATITPADGEAPAGEVQLNDTLRNLTGRQFQGIQRVVRDYNRDKISYDAAADMLKKAFGMDDEQVTIWLGTKEEITV